jgi:hypothetical protein
MLITSSASDCRETLLRYTHEVVFGSRSSNSINCYTKAAIRAILKANGERQARSELSV